MKWSVAVLLSLGVAWLVYSQSPFAQESAKTPASSSTQEPAKAPPAPGPITLTQGGNYRAITAPQPTQTGNKIEVLEIFWYGCPHCFTFEPYINQWLKTKPADVEFRRLPAVFGDKWAPGARVFYTAWALNVLDKVHPAFFHALHEEQRKFESADDYAPLFVQAGVNQDDFSKMFTSSDIDEKVKQAALQGQAYGIEGVPSVIVNGKYLTAGAMAGSYEAMIQVINGLIELSRHEKGMTAPPAVAR